MAQAGTGEVRTIVDEWPATGFAYRFPRATKCLTGEILVSLYGEQ